MSSARAVAARILHRVLSGESLNKLLPHALDSADLADRPLCQELSTARCVSGRTSKPSLSVSCESQCGARITTF